MILGSGLLQSTGPSFGTVSADSSDSALFSGYTPNVGTVGPVSRRLYFGKSGGEWKTLWTDTTGALLRGDELGTYAVTKASDGPAPFDTDDGLATDTHSGSVSAGTTFTHESDFVMEFTVDTLPSAGGIYTWVRAADSNNKYQVYVSSTGGFGMDEVVGGAPTNRADVASIVSAGHRIVITAEGSTIKGYSNNTLRWSYSSASNFATETDGRVDWLGVGGAASNLYTWPRTLSGTAATILDKVSA